MSRTPIHPGEILGDELEEAGLTTHKLAEILQVRSDRLDQSLAGERNLTADTALRLARYFGMSPQFWLGLQMDYDLDLETDRLESRLNAVKTYSGEFKGAQS